MSLFIIISHIALNNNFYIVFAFLKKKKEKLRVNNEEFTNVVQTSRF